MRILRNYILWECVSPFFLALGVLTSVFLLGNMVHLAHLVINKGVSLWVIGEVFLLYVPVLLGYTLPIACLVGVILAFGRLSADNEILAMRACGIHLRKLIAPLFTIGVICSLFSFLLNDRIVPYAFHQQKLLLKSLGTSNPTALLEPGVFINSFEGQVLFIHRVEDNKMFNITIYQPQPDGKPTRTIIASRGEFTRVPEKDQIILKLIDGASDEPDMKNPHNFYKLNFKNFFMTLDLGKAREKVDKKPKSMSLKELTMEKVRLDTLLVDTSRLVTEYFRKITWSFSPLIFMLVGFPLAVITNRREKSSNIIVAVVFATIYYLLTMGCEALGSEHVIPPNFVMFIPTILGLGVAFFLNFKTFKT